MERKNIKLIYLFNLSAILFMLAYSMIIGINGNDFWWHVKTGDWILENNTIPKTDVFSWYASSNNYTWFAHEWGADVIYSLIHTVFGLKGICVFAIFIIGINHLLLMRLTQKRWENNLLFAFFWFLYNLAMLSFTLYCRPVIFSYIFLSIELYLLFEFKENKNYKKIFFIPLIAIFWVNMHGGSSNLSYLLILIFLITSLIPSFSYNRLENKLSNREDNKNLFIVFILTILANIINPYGVKMVLYPYKYMVEGSFDMKVISEWQALDLKTFLGIILIIGLVVMTIFILISKKNIKLYEFVLYGMFTYLMLKSIRFEFLFFIVTSFIIFNYVPDEIKTFIDEKFFNIMLKSFSVVIVIFSLIVLFISKDNLYVAPTIPKEVISLIKESDNKKLFNFYDYGGELIYNGIEPFIDSRADVYSGNGTALEDSWSMVELDNEYLEETKSLDISYYIDEKYKFDSILIPENAPLNVYLETRDDFKQVYKDKGFSYWERIEKE